MKIQKTMNLIFSLGLLAALLGLPGAISALAAQVPDLPESANVDGFADLAVGIPGRAVGGDPGAGAVGMLYGTASGLTSAASFLFSQDTGLIDGAAEPLDHFGKALAAGDFDGDGLVDLAVSTPDEDVGDAEGAGLIHILFGGITSITSSGSQMITEDDIGGTAKLNERFGAALASGDFNRDGYDDLAVSAPGEDFVTIESAGIVFVLKGTPNGLSTTGIFLIWQGLPAGMLEQPEEADNFGSVLTVGDFDGDGYHDLAIGTPNETITDPAANYAGVVQVVYGSSNGLTTSGNQLWYQGQTVGDFTIQDEPSDYDMFGEVLAAGDFDFDGYDDLAIGVPHEFYYHNDSGIVQILKGSAAGLKAQYNRLLHQELIEPYTHEEFDLFGAALAYGDFDGDGYEDLTIGAPGQDVSALDQAGSVHVIFGKTFPVGTHSWNNPNPEADDRFGAALAIGDTDHNGYDDLVIGVPENDGSAANTGMIYVSRRAEASWWVFSSFGIADIGDSLAPAANDLFGSALAILDEPNTDIRHLFLPTIKN